MPDSDDDVVIPRRETMRILSRGRDAIFKLEKEGRLRKVRLTTSPKGHVLHPLSDVKALMQPETTSPGPALPLKRAVLRPEPPAPPKIERAVLRRR